MIRRPPRSTLSSSSAASDVYKRQEYMGLKTNIKQYNMNKIILLISSLYLVSSLSYNGIIKVGEEGTRKNPAFFPVSGTCTINSGSSTINFKVIKGWIQIDGQKYTAGSSGSIQTAPGQVIQGKVSGFAQGWGKNSGPDALNYTCSGDLGLMRLFAEEITETVTINPGKSSTIRSPIFWSATINCKVSCTGSNIVQITNKDGSIKINNTQLGDGQSINITVSNGDSFLAHLSGHAEAEFFDFGTNAVTATCSTDLDEYPTEFITETIGIVPGQSKYYHNPLSYEINLKCVTVCQGTNEIVAHNLQGNMFLNSKRLEQGNSMRIYVINGTEYTISFAEYAEASLQNLGDSEVDFVCSIDLQSDYENFIPQPVIELSRVVSLPAGASKKETSPVFWAVSGTCTVLAPSGNTDQITFKVLSGDAWFGKGDSATTKVQGQMSLNVTAGEKFTVKVGGDASGQLTNDGKYTLTANCTADLSDSQMKFLE
eukprot:TRINITY_DN199_c0_g1_i1.p1 TRINITY_DN199_c0_g1~~TRINITY_DN199_c0_g1_i1.p1  ORF type:complete len:484 (-),score=89.48 TRINITY_DN199_c0_g1_i1:208-1659(-)